MFKIAIVENEQPAIDQIEAHLNRYAKENELFFKIETFKDGKDFLEDYKSFYDVIFMDVDMPEVNGFKAAKKLRQIDTNVILVFVTNLSRYAIKGYEYGAMDYILKPLEYSSFALKLNRIVTACERNKINKTVWLQTSPNRVSVEINSILYVEVIKHKIIYHTQKGDYVAYGTMKKAEEVLTDDCFVRCNSCYLVNLQHVKEISGFTVVVGEDSLVISHPRKKSFIEALHRYYAGR